VLELAQDPGAPLLERAKFLAIFASNLDEFFMVAGAGLKRRQSNRLWASARRRPGHAASSWPASRRGPRAGRPHACSFIEDVRPGLADAGLRIVLWRDLPAEQQRRCTSWFRAQLFPVLTPLAVDPRTRSRTSAACR
jgi:polyphosphate kinase